MGTFHTLHHAPALCLITPFIPPPIHREGLIQIPVVPCESFQQRAQSLPQITQTMHTVKVSFRSPWYPPRNAVTSTLTMSPLCSSRASGMPWQMTSLTEVHTDCAEEGGGGKRVSSLRLAPPNLPLLHPAIYPLRTEQLTLGNL